MKKRRPRTTPALNAFLSVRDVSLIVRELEHYEDRLSNLSDRDALSDRRHVKKLIERLYAVKWTPAHDE